MRATHVRICARGGEQSPSLPLQVQAPCGDFVLVEAQGSRRALVLLTGGVGITPAMSMLQAAAPAGRPIYFIHAANHGGVHVFRGRVDAIAAHHDNVRALYVYAEPRSADTPHLTGLVTRGLLASVLPADGDVDLYFLGSKPFMQAAYANGLALGVPKERLRYEFFGPTEALGAA